MDIAEIITQGRRMCKEYPRCEGCPFAGWDGGCNPLKNNRSIKNLCDVILHWSASHPEPRYPTWAEWWATLPEGTTWIVVKRHSVNYYGMSYLSVCDFATMKTTGLDINSPIPSDLAEKLGIKPINQAKE